MYCIVNPVVLRQHHRNRAVGVGAEVTRRRPGSTDQFDLGAVPWAQELEEAGDGLLIAAQSSRPESWSTTTVM